MAMTMTETETVFKTKSITQQQQQQQWTVLRVPAVIVTTIHQLLSNTAGLLFESLFDTTPASKGVYYDIRTDDHHHLLSSPSDPSRKSSNTIQTMESNDTAVITMNHTSSSSNYDDEDGEQTETIESTKNKGDNYIPSWIPSDRENHHDKLPSEYYGDKSSSHEIIRSENAEDGRTVRLLKQKSFSHKQGKIPKTTTLASLPLRVVQTAQEPPKPGKYASNHIMINNERRKRKIPPLRREHYLDTLARKHATAMASRRSLFHSDNPHELLTRIQQEQEETTTKDDADDSYYVPQRIGMNIASGTSIATIHKFMMAALAERNNMRDTRFCLMGMGMGIARARADVDEDEGGKTGGDADVLYLCQLFAG